MALFEELLTRMGLFYIYFIFYLLGPELGLMINVHGYIVGLQAMRRFNSNIFAIHNVCVILYL